MIKLKHNQVCLEDLRAFLKEQIEIYSSRERSLRSTSDEGGAMFCLGKRSAFLDTLYQLDYMESGVI